MSDFDSIREEGERISREEGYKVLLAEIAARDKEIARLRLTEAERSAIRDAADRYASITPESAETAATLRGLLDRTGRTAGR